MLQISQWDKWPQELRSNPFLPLCARLKDAQKGLRKTLYLLHKQRQESQIIQQSPNYTTVPNSQTQHLSHKTHRLPKTQSLTANCNSITVFKAFSSWHKWSLVCSKLCFNIRLTVTSAWLYPKTGYWWVGRCWEKVQGHMLHSSGRCLYLILVTSSSSLKEWHWQKLHKDLPILLYYKEGHYDLSPLWGEEKKEMRKRKLTALKSSQNLRAALQVYGK